MIVYGKKQPIRFRIRLTKAWFLKGQLVRTVWCELESEKGDWSKPRLLLSTDTTMIALEVIEAYRLRWPIEPMFYQLMHLWELKEMWQQIRQTPHRWVYVTTPGYGLLHLLTLVLSKKSEPLCINAFWLFRDPITAGRVRLGLIKNFYHVNVRQWWNKKCEKFEPSNVVDYLEYG